MTDNTCRNCGKPIKPEPGRKYCGNTCRYYYAYKVRCAREPERGLYDDPMQFDRQRVLSVFLEKLQASGQVHG